MNMATRINAVLNERGMSKTDLWKGVGVSSGAVSHWLNGGKLSGENLVKVSKVLRVNPVWLETGKGVKDGENRKLEEITVNDESEYVGIKRVDFKISAGVSGFAIEYYDGERSPIFFRRDWIEKNGYDQEKLFAMPVSGESMIPTLYPDDMIVGNAADTKRVEGEVYAVNYDGELVIKRLHREAGQWFLSSDNPDKRRFANKLCHENSFIIGRIIYKQSERI
jgi:phage repressor protein C with HTH and peptisase S24 domain